MTYHAAIPPPGFHIQPLARPVAAEPEKEHNTVAIVAGVLGGLVGTAALAGVAVVLARSGAVPAAISSLPGTLSSLPGHLASLPAKVHLPGSLRMPGWQKADWAESQPASPVSWLGDVKQGRLAGWVPADVTVGRDVHVRGLGGVGRWGLGGMCRRVQRREEYHQTTRC